MGKKSTQTQKSESGNYAYETLKAAYTPAIAQGNTAGTSLAAMLGLGGDTAAQMAAFQNYLDNSGYQFALDQGQRMIEGSAAGRGLLRSGATLRGLSDYGQQTSQQFLGQYLDRLAQQQSMGMNAGQILSGAGQWNKSEGKSEQSSGIGGILGSALSLAAAIPTGGASLAGLGGIGAGIGGLAGRFG